MVAKISGTHRKAFLRALAETGNVTLAADQMRVSKDWVYKLRRRDAAFDVIHVGLVDLALPIVLNEFGELRRQFLVCHNPSFRSPLGCARY